MGKPSSTKLSKKSDHSLLSNSSKKKMNKAMRSQKVANRKKRRRSNTKKKIKHLFNQLRKESCSSLELPQSDTVVQFQNNTIIELNNTTSPLNKKRKFSMCGSNENDNTKKFCSNNFIVIKDDDDDDVVTSTLPCNMNTPVKLMSSPMKSSTPILNSNIRLKDSNGLNASINSNNIQNELDNLTKEINRDSYLTIDLTTEGDMNKTNTTQDNTVIDLINISDNQDCSVVSASNVSSMSGDSDVTVLNRPQLKRNKERQMLKFANGIASLDSSEKNKLLELITQKIFNGCNMPKNIKRSISNIKETVNCSTETVEDNYIKTIILGQSQSRNSIGSNIYNPERDQKNKTGLRMIVIDGSNVAMEHSKGKVFSVKGLKICINYFLKRGHIVKAFVPRFRCKFGKSTDPRQLDAMERDGLVIYTPSREIKGRMITSYDDRYIIQCAAEFNGIIVTGDNYKDLLRENPRWRYIIENRLLPFTWVNDMIMFPKDPLGRYGPTLDQFLRHTSDSPSL